MVLGAYRVFGRDRHTITYNEATKVTSIQSCTVTVHPAGSPEYKACAEKMDKNAAPAGYDKIRD